MRMNVDEARRDEPAARVDLLLAPGEVLSDGRDPAALDGEVSLIGHQRLVIQRFAIGIQAIPERERNSKEPLPTNQPVAVEAFNPIVVAGLHVGRMPGDLVGALQHDIA